MLLLAAACLLLGSPAGAGPAQDTKPSLSARIAELRRGLEEIRAEFDRLRDQGGPLPPAPPVPVSSDRSRENLPPERELELLEGLANDLRASVKNLKSDLAFRQAAPRLAEDLAGRKATYGKVKLGDAAPTPPRPPTPAPPAPPPDPTPQVAGRVPPATAPAAIAVERPAPQLPPEALSGADRVVVRVNGIDVRKSEVDPLVVYQRITSSGPDGLLIRDALDRALIPTKVVLARYKDKLEALQAKADKILSDLAAGKDFAELAKLNSDDRTTAPNGGDLGTFGREDFKLPFALVAFTAEKGKVSKPFWTPFGLNLLLVDDVTKGESPSLDRARGRYILLAFDPRDPNFYQTLNRLTDEAKVEVVDPAYHNAVPPRYLRAR